MICRSPVDENGAPFALQESPGDLPRDGSEHPLDVNRSRD